MDLGLAPLGLRDLLREYDRDEEVADERHQTVPNNVASGFDPVRLEQSLNQVVVEIRPVLLTDYLADEVAELKTVLEHPPEGDDFKLDELPFGLIWVCVGDFIFDLSFSLFVVDASGGEYHGVQRVFLLASLDLSNLPRVVRLERRVVEDFPRNRRVFLDQLDQVLDAVNDVVDSELGQLQGDLQEQLALVRDLGLLVVVIVEGPLEDRLLVVKALRMSRLFVTLVLPRAVDRRNQVDAQLARGYLVQLVTLDFRQSLREEMQHLLIIVKDAVEVLTAVEGRNRIEVDHLWILSLGNLLLHV